MSALDTINVSLLFEDEEPEVVSVPSNQTIKELRAFITNQFSIAAQNSVVYVDGFLADEYQVLRNLCIDPIPEIRIMIPQPMFSLSLYYGEIVFSTSYPEWVTLEFVVRGLNSYLIRQYDTMVSPLDVIIQHNAESYFPSATLSELHLTEPDVLQFVIPQDVEVNPFVLAYAHECHRRLQLDRELLDIKGDSERLLKHADSLEQKLKGLENPSARIVELEEQCKALQEENNALNARVQAYSNIDGVEGGELRKRCREQEFEISKYQECIKELEATSEEDRQRIDQLLNECKTLSGQVNEENEEKEKYKTGYVNMKRRIDKMETKMKEVKCLTSAAVSECFQFVVEDGKDSLQQMKDDIMENNAYHIIVLNLQHSEFDDATIDEFFQLIEIGLFPSLRIIDLYDCKLTEAAVASLIHWQTLYPFIDILSPDLLQSKLPSDVFAEFSKRITQESSQKVLDLRNLNLGDDGILLLCELLTHNLFPDLHTLLLDYNNITDPGIRALCVTINTATLDHSLVALSITGNALSLTGVTALCSFIRNNSNLQRLWISNCGITDEGLEAICSALVSSNCFSLQLLNLTDNAITSRGIRALKQLIDLHMFQITDLGLVNDPIGDEGLETLVTAMKDAPIHIDKLYLRCTGITGASMAALSQAVAHGDLTFCELGLSQNDIGSDGFKTLVDGLVAAGLRLHKLWLFESGLDENAAEGFVRLISDRLFDKLTLLDVAGNNLSEEVFSLMCSAILDAKIPLVLEELWLGGCPIQDSGVQMLASLIRNNFMPHLHTLSIDSGRGF
ncbi:hypothetical protein WA538_003787 [Blastocystis sp. DL]